MKKCADMIVPAALLAATLCLILLPQETSAAVTAGLQLCAAKLVPALFPFFICINLATGLGLAERLGRLLAPLMGRIFHLSGAGSTVLIFGALGGYPAGAQSAAALFQAKQLSRKETDYLLLFCNNAGPSFLFGAAGAFWGSTRAVFLLWFAQLASAALVGLLYRPRTRLPAPARAVSEPPEFSEAFLNAVRDAGQCVLQITMFVTAFSVMTHLILRMLQPVLSPVSRAMLTGALELSSGLHALGALQLPMRWKLAAASALCAFGGFCVLLQTKAVLSAAALSVRGYLRAKLLQAIFAAAIAVFFAPLLPEETAAMAVNSLPSALPALRLLAFSGFCLGCRKLRLDISSEIRYNEFKCKREG